MDGPPARMSKQTAPISIPFWKTYGFCLLVLLIIATSIRGWLLCHTEVTSRDSIGFERFAWELEHKKWKQALRSNVHHPLYPLTVLAMSVPVRQFVGGSDLEVMQLSAQLASGLAGILLVIPMFFLGKELFDQRVGFWSAAIFQCLPVGARVMSDALSESLFLLTSAMALLFALRGFSGIQNQKSGAENNPRWSVFGFRISNFGFAGCGIFTGLAYLTRPEGILIAVAVIIVVACGRWLFQKKPTCIRAATSLGVLLASTAVVAGPYITIIQGFSNKTTTRDILKSEIQNPKFKNRDPKSSRPEFLGLQGQFDNPDEKSGTLRHHPFSVFGSRISDFGFGASSFAIWWPDGKVSDLRRHLGWSIYALVSELCKGFFYGAWILALIGLWAFRQRLMMWSGHSVLLVLCLLQCLALLRVAMFAGYLSDRHVLIIVLCGLYWGAAAVYMLTEGIRAREGWFRRLFPSAALLFLVLAGVALPKTLEPLHTNRAGHHAVGLWLAEHITPADELDDPFCWAAHYAGRTFLRDAKVSSPCVTQRYRYVVHDCRPDHRDRFRKASAPVDDLIAAGGKAVYHWPEGMPEEEASIILFAVPLAANK